MKKIFIDPGHGGMSVGASYKGRREQDDCLRLALAVKSILSSQEGVEVRLSREDNSNPSIEKRCRDANEWGADYFLSIHRNAFAPNAAAGVEAWVYSKVETGGETYTLAENIIDEICKAVPFIDRGVKKGAPAYTDFGVNRMTVMSSCLLETGFIDSDTDNALFDGYFADIALAVARALMKNVGLVYKERMVPGDADGDGRVTAADARLILRAAAGLESIAAEVGDLDGDGKITASDARDALRLSIETEE